MISSNTTCPSASFLKALSFKSPARKWATSTVNWLICSMMYYRVREKDKTCDLRTEKQCCTETTVLDSPLCNSISYLKNKVEHKAVVQKLVCKVTLDDRQDLRAWVREIHTNTHTRTGQMANKRSHSVLAFSHRLQMIWFLLLVWTG